MPTKTPEKKASSGKANALQKPLQPSEELAAVVKARFGSDRMPARDSSTRRCGGTW
jgi:hypothetical protein